MIVLPTTSDRLEVALAGAVATNELDCYAAWRDITTTTYVADRQTTPTVGALDANLVPPPPASTQRVIDFISIYNRDTAPATVTVKHDLSTIERILWRGQLLPGESLYYNDGAGFSVTQNAPYQPIKAFTVHGDASANFAMTNATLAERLAANTSRHIFLVDLAGYTQVRLRGNLMVTGTAGSLFRAKYASAFTTVLGSFLQLGSAGQVEFSCSGTGYRDTGWVDLAVGARINGCCIGFTELGGDGVADPALGATDILFR
jgi:hypothetical protein